MSGPRALSLFAGIGGFDLGLERAGFTVVGQVELEPFCQRVLAARWPGVERAGDVRAFRREESGDREPADAAGVSRAGEPLVHLLVGGFPCQDLSVAGKRAGLGGERSGLFWEIVRIAKITRPTWGLFENVPGLLSSNSGRDMWTVLQGLRECWPAVGYRILDSRYFGVAQRRRRVFFVGGPTEAGVAQVLALFSGSEGDPQAGGEAGAHVAHAISAGAGGSKFGPGRDGQDDFVIADPISASEGRTYTHEGKTGMRTHNVVAFHEDQRTGAVYENDHTHALAQPGGKPGQGYQAVREGSAVRRLTPLECERLQGFPDGWTCLCQPLEAYAADPDAAALACTCPDSPRYRALGNAVTVNVIRWLGQRLQEVMR